jgi:hypothetical protein
MYQNALSEGPCMYCTPVLAFNECVCHADFSSALADGGLDPLAFGQRRTRPRNWILGPNGFWPNSMRRSLANGGDTRLPGARELDRLISSDVGHPTFRVIIRLWISLCVQVTEGPRRTPTIIVF